jgi:hypothetical protein
VGSFVAYAVENPLDRGISAVSNRSLVNLATRGNRAVTDRFAYYFTFTNIGTAVVRIGSKAPPATTRGSVV